MRGIILDTETTGLLLPSSAPLPQQPYIVELGFVVVDNGKIIDEYNQLIDPGVPMPAEATKISGITDEDLIGKPTFKELFQETKEIFECGIDYVIAHNMPFDSGMINNECKRIGEKFPWPKNVICSVEECKFMFGRRMKLIELYERATGKKLAQTHRAIDDVMALHEALKAHGFFEMLEKST